MSVRVVKIGGAALADAGWLERLAAVVARSAEPLVFVHGGGPEITALSERLGVEVKWVNGRRVTSEEALDVAAMVLSGRVNKRIVSSLVGAGVQALGVSGEDLGLLVAEAREGGALGRVGTLASVRADVLRSFIALGFVPVVSPISRATDGGAYNVNADEVATAVAVALGADELLFLTDVDGVRDATGTVPSLSAEDAQALVAGSVATGGMAVKIEAGVAALKAGVACVRIGGLEMLVDAHAGTTLNNALEVVA